jgi:acetamidase/formamidase
LPGFGFLAEEFKEPYLKVFTFKPGDTLARFSDRISIPVRPFAGVMGVAPPTDSMLVTIPPRANGGNLDNHYLVAGTTVYFPVFVAGALFSVGDTHAAQGDGEVAGTGIEGPMRVVYEVRVIKGGRKMLEPQYETDEYYAVGAHGKSLEEAAKNATRYMIDYLVTEHGLSRAEAYVLCSLAGDLKVAEVVDMPHYWVAMHIPKKIFRQ